MKKFQWKISSAKLKCPRCGSKVVMQFVGRWRIRGAEEGKGIEPRDVGSEVGMGGVDDTGSEPPSARDDSDG